METIVLFGGSFDPPHIAHETIVQEVLKISDVDKVIVMPTYLNPFKSSFCAPATTRIQWLKKIFKNYPKVLISDFEVSSKRKVPSIESVKHLLKSYKKIYLAIGADNLKDLHKWKKYDELKDLVTFVIISRDNIPIANSYLNIQVNIDISSSEFRKNLNKKNLSAICAEEIMQFYKEKNDI